MSSVLFRRLQSYTFVLTWLAYGSFYLNRKPVSIVKNHLQSNMGFSTSSLGMLDTGFLTAYALGNFVWGPLGDKIGARRLLAAGLVGSAVCTGLCGMTDSPFIMICLWSLNGLFQACGWSCCVKALSPWFPSNTRGRIMGFWGTCQNAGGIGGTALAAYLLASTSSMQSVFQTPAVFVTIIGVAVYFTLFEHPSQANLAIPPGFEDEDLEHDEDEKDAKQSDGEAVTMSTAIKLPFVLNIALAYFAMKLIRYSLLFWLPFYLETALHYEPDVAGYLSTSFEIGGVVGSVVTGWLSDTYAPKRRLLVVAPMSLITGVFIFLYAQMGSISVAMNVSLMSIVGVLLAGPDALMSGAIPQDIGEKAGYGNAAVSTICGLINGVGSLGAIFQGPITSTVVDTMGWSALWTVLTMLAGATFLLLYAPFKYQWRSYNAAHSRGDIPLTMKE